MNDQHAYWNGPQGDRWAREQEALDRMLHSYGEAVLAALHPAHGERAIDVGCGCGDTTLELAERVGSGGRVLGLDLSEPMLARARERAAGRANVSFLAGDATTASLEAHHFDVLFSRFGVMFFPDPVGAFTHLRSALRPRGRLAFVCWRPVKENPWARVPFDAVADVLGRPEPTPPDAPGPFSSGDPARVRRVLDDAGYREVAIAPFDTTNRFGVGASTADAARELARLGPAARLLVDRSEGEISKAIGAIERALPPYVSADGGVAFPAAAWVVTATTA